MIIFGTYCNVKAHCNPVTWQWLRMWSKFHVRKSQANTCLRFIDVVTWNWNAPIVSNMDLDHIKHHLYVSCFCVQPVIVTSTQSLWQSVTMIDPIIWQKSDSITLHYPLRMWSNLATSFSRLTPFWAIPKHKVATASVFIDVHHAFYLDTDWYCPLVETYLVNESNHCLISLLQRLGCQQ